MRREQLLVREFVAKRPVMVENNRDPKRMAELLKQEMAELEVELEQENIGKIAQEIPDIIWFCFTIAEFYGIDVEDEFWGKAFRNHAKYPEGLFDGSMTYEEASTICRALWGQDRDANYRPDVV